VREREGVCLNNEPFQSWPYYFVFQLKDHVRDHWDGRAQCGAATVIKTRNTCSVFLGRGVPVWQTYAMVHLLSKEVCCRCWPSLSSASGLCCETLFSPHAYTV